MSGRFAGVSEENWRSFVADVAELLEIREGERIFEVGDDAGAFVEPLRDAGCVVGTGPASSLDPSGEWDVVLACGAFASFPSLEYASDVVARMMAKADRAVAVLDVPDEDEKSDGPGVPGRLYFTRSWFLRTLGALGAQAVELTEARIEGYADGRHRFNVIARLR